MKGGKKIDVALVIGMAIPVVMIVLVAGAIYAPRLFVGIDDPGYDFLYTVGDSQGYSCFVWDGRLRLEGPKDEGAASLPSGPPKLKFFIHRVRDNASERLSFDQASALRLDDSALSPDGYELVYGRRSEFLFIWTRRDYQTRYIRKDGRATELALEFGEGANHAYSFNFLGWIEE